MESFVESSKKALTQLSSYEKIRVVLGNRTCDLDSAVCALVQGLVEYLDIKQQKLQNVAVIPVMNIPEKEFRIKTEVIYCMKQNGIPLKLLTFRDQINLEDISHTGKLELILVDHHALAKEDASLAKSVVEIIDHRPQDPSWAWPGKKITLKLVGSCATLVAQNLISRHSDVINAQLANLLRGPILIDTSNLSKETNRATPTDLEVIECLEKIGALKTSRDDTFNQILTAKTSIDDLTPDDLIIKDLKFTNEGIPIIGLPMLVENFLAMNNAVEAIHRFVQEKGQTLAVIVGIHLANQHVAKDIAVFASKGEPLQEKVTAALISSSQPSLQLKLVKQVQGESYNLHVYRQGNLRASRKQILPIIQRATSNDSQS